MSFSGLSHLFFATLGLRFSMQASLVVVCGLSYPVACGISVPGPEIEPESPALEGKSSTTGPPGKTLRLFLILTALIGR